MIVIVDIDRMKFINRWGLMRNVRVENIAEHSHQVSVLAYTLALIENEMYGGKVNAERAAVIAMFHEAGEVVTGDLPTPVKYFNHEINSAYKDIEKIAEDKLISMLPDFLKEVMKNNIQPNKDEAEYKIVKAADKISAFIKCIEEQKSGNSEFDMAKQTMEKSIRELNLKSADYFMDNFIEAYYMALDELL